MKKLLMGSIALTMFSISIILFQFSCKKEANAQTTTTGLTQQNILLVHKITDNPSRVDELWTSNYDGSNQKKIPITLTAGQSMPDVPAKLSPDGKTVFLTINERRIISGVSTSVSTVYSCNIDGSNFKQIIDLKGNEVHLELTGAY